MRLALPGLLALTACSAQFKPETLVDAMRVLSITAEPPEVAPGGDSTLSALELDPSRPGGLTTLIWVGCDADPVDFNRSTCADVSALLHPSVFADYPPDMHLLGFGPTATYTAAPTLFDRVAAGDPVRLNGTSGPVLLVVVGAEIKPVMAIDELRVIFGQMERQEVPSVLALTRVQVSERAEKNHNPQVSRITVDGVALPRGGHLLVHEGQRVSLHTEAPAAARESYTVVTPTGTETRVEKLVAAWYSSSGRFTQERVDLDSIEDPVFVAPGATADDPVPARRQGVAFVVLRDDRAGESNVTVPFVLCDSSPAPTVTEVVLPTSAQELVTVRGTNLSSVVDIVINDVALEHASYNAATDTFLGQLPVLPTGRYSVRVRSKRCDDVDTGLTILLP